MEYQAQDSKYFQMFFGTPPSETPQFVLLWLYYLTLDWQILKFIENFWKF